MFVLNRSNCGLRPGAIPGPVKQKIWAGVCQDLKRPDSKYKTWFAKMKDEFDKSLLEEPCKTPRGPYTKRNNVVKLDFSFVNE
jgi:hypothetical protein